MASPSSFPRLRREWVGSTSAHNWGGALPAVVRLLADRRADVSLPACPLVRAGERWEETFARAMPYWTALDHVLRYQLGWTFPSQGLARWLDEGSPDQVRPLALVRHVWLGDGSLHRYMAWRVQKGVDHLPSAWLKRVAGTVFEFGKEGETVGPWELHLEEPGMHALAPLDGAPPRLTWLHPFEPPAARQPPRLVGESEPVLLFRGGLETGWYGALEYAPTSAVRVVSEEYGLCGRFRRSPTTGRWHTVPEEVHAWGVRPL
jgi:hypothetical protein